MMRLGLVRKVISYNCLYLITSFFFRDSFSLLSDEFHPYVLEVRTNMDTKILGNTNKCIFFLILSSCMFRHCRHIQEAYTKISLKHTSISMLLTVYCKPHSSEAGISDIIFVINSKNSL
jgi:hypothetical protein